MKLTEKQRTCPVCHGDVALKDVYQGHDNNHSLWIDGNKLYEILVYDGALVLKTNKDVPTTDFEQPIIIDYCPICGRPLDGDPE